MGISMMKKISLFILLGFASSLSITHVGAEPSAAPSPSVQSSNVEGKKDVHPHFQTFLEALEKLPNGGHQSDVKEGRLAYEKLAAYQSGPMVSVRRVEDVSVPSTDKDGHAIPIRIYTPEVGKKLPVIMYHHGGGWQRGSLNTHDSICRRLATKTGCIVVSVDWRLAPEHQFPAGLNDAYDVYNWIADGKGGEFNMDGSRIAISGDSAGGNVTAGLALKLKQEGKNMPKFQMLFYPSLDLTMSTESYKKFEKGYFLTAAGVKEYRDGYFPAEHHTNPLASPALATDLTGLPPTHVVVAGNDPLRDEGESFAEKLKNAGVDASHKAYDGMIHAFLHFTGAIPEMEDHFDEWATMFKKYLRE